MKKILVTLTILASSVMLANAQAPYKIGLGATLGSFEGFSFKTFLGSNLGLQADLGYTWWMYGAHGYGGAINANVNLMYQAPIKEWGAGRLDWYAGGGLTAGYLFSVRGLKVGVNGIAGLEWIFNSFPLALSFDFRPGLGMLISGNYVYSYFDWGANLGCRYTIGN
jgi:hypothetical protein